MLLVLQRKHTRLYCIRSWLLFFTVNRLELLPALQRKYSDDLNPAISAIKFCQNHEAVWIELYLHQDPMPQISDLKFLGGEIVTDELSGEEMITPLFFPDADIVDNACLFLDLDDFSMVICLDHLLTPERTDRICLEHQVAILQQHAMS